MPVYSYSPKYGFISNQSSESLELQVATSRRLTQRTLPSTPLRPFNLCRPKHLCRHAAAVPEEDGDTVEGGTTGAGGGGVEVDPADGEGGGEEGEEGKKGEEGIVHGCGSEMSLELLVGKMGTLEMGGGKIYTRFKLGHVCFSLRGARCEYQPRI